MESRTIGIRLSELARIKGVKQSEIADRCRISRISINRFFKGHSELKASDLRNVLSVLGIHLDHEIDSRLESGRDGKIQEDDPIYIDITQILRGLDLQVKKTILEQIAWFGQLNRQRVPQTSLNRIESWLGKRKH